MLGIPDRVIDPRVGSADCLDRKWAIGDKWEKHYGWSWLLVGLGGAAVLSAVGVAVFWFVFFLVVWTYRWIRAGFVGPRRSQGAEPC